VLPLIDTTLISDADRWDFPVRVTSGGVTAGPLTKKPIPFSDIEVFVNRQRPETRCLSLDEIQEELCRRGYLPALLCTTEGQEPDGALASGNCEANDNLGETADSFISRCRLASIRREFPSEFLNETLGTIKKGKTAKHRKAWKLLNDNRFKKPGAGATAAPCPVPVNYKETSASAGGGVLRFRYAWDSSTGKVADLKDVEVGEFVTYPGASPFVWPKPPWDGSTPNPTELWPSPGTDGAMGDVHSSKPFVKPYKEAGFTATQHYRYRTPCANGGNPVNLMGPISIVRAVKQKANGDFVYVITKSGKSAKIDPLP
jgi:hypothetical protein